MFYDRAHCPTLNRIRDDPVDRMLTSATFTDSAHMTVESCIGFCNQRNYLYAGVENGEDCCECSSRHCLFQFRDSVILITRFGCQIAEIIWPEVQKSDCPPNAVSNAPAIVVRFVAPVIILTFIGAVRVLYLPSFQKSTFGFTSGATSKHIRFAFLFGSGPVTDLCTPQTAIRKIRGL